MHSQHGLRFHQLKKLAAIPLLLLSLAAAVRAQSALDGFDPNADGEVIVVVVQSDGKILLGGTFTSLSPNGGTAVTRNRIARLNPDGTLDVLFNPNASGNVLSIAVQADGKVLAGGTFTSIGGQMRNNIARLDATTGAADSFNPNANDYVRSIAVQTDGKILAAGGFNGANSIGGQTRNYIARLDATTGAADSWDANSNGPIRVIVLPSDGKILVAGSFSGTNSIGGQARNRLARLDPTTALADSFNPDASGNIYAIAVQADGKIVVGGFFLHFGTPNIGGQPRNYMARLDPTTGLADSFNPDPGETVQAIAVQPDGKILVGGWFRSIGGQPRRGIARLNATTGLPDSFDPKVDPNEMGNRFVNAIAVQADGKVLAGGDFVLLAPNGGPAVTRNRIARLEADGRLDQTLNLSAVASVGSNVFATAVQPDGKILIGGFFTNVLGVTRNNIARVNTDGTLDTAFDPNANAQVFSIAMQADGRILVGGAFTGIGGQGRNRIARLDATTGLADPFDPNANEYISTIAVQADGKVLAGGLFTSIGGQMRNRIARLDATTGLADSFNPGANSDVLSIAVEADGKILAGGGFTSIGGQTRNRIARLDATTGLADSFDPNATDGVFAIAVQADGKILAGGQFGTIGGRTRRGIARLDATTGVADSFNPNANSSVFAIAVQADGRILAGGFFFGANSIGGQTRNHIARLDATIGLADSFDPNADGLGVYSIAVRADGKILAGGDFTTIGGQSRSLFARLTNDTAALQNLVVTQTTITWTPGGSSPQFTRVTFEYSTDNANYAPLGNGTAAGSNWTLTGLNLPTQQNIYIRARGYYRSGYHNASESITESVRNAFFVPPAITSANNTTFTVGTAGTFSVTTTGIPTGAGMAITESGALPAGVTFTNNNNGTATLAGTPGAGTAGTYPLIITANNGVMPNATQNFTLTVIASATTPTPTPPATPGVFGNIATRLLVETGDNILIGGFIITGTHPKRIIVRAIGPSLSSFFLGTLPDPILELRNSSGDLLASNDNWRSDQEAEIIATGIPPGSDQESAIVATLPANSSAYTALVRGANNGTGIGVVEVYDLDPSANSKLANISTRGFVQTGDDILIGGLIVVGQSPLPVIVRAIGPSLPVTGALENPTLELHDANGASIATNDNWRSDQEAEIIATGIPPPNDLESAIVRNLAPGNYTAIVLGVNNTTGIAVVEAYGLN